MSAQAQAILEQALRLSADERAHLADALQRSLEDGASGLPPDEVARLWNEEIKRRLARARERVARGEPTGRSADEVYADAEARMFAASDPVAEAPAIVRLAAFPLMRTPRGA